MNNESVGKKIVEALKKQAENMDMEEQNIDTTLFDEPVEEEPDDADKFIDATDADWEEFNKSLEKMGIDEFVSLMQESYDVYMEAQK